MQIISKIVNYSKYDKGFTIVEVLVTLLIISILSGAFIAVLLTGTDSFQINSTNIYLQQELRKSLGWMINELRQAGNNSIIDVPADNAWYNTITFRIPSGVINGSLVWSVDTIQFLRAGTGLRQLRRVSAGEYKILAHDITALQFRRQAATPNILEVALTAQQNTTKGRSITLNLNFEIKLRN